jgi:hypothetical protein
MSLLDAILDWFAPSIDNVRTGFTTSTAGLSLIFIVACTVIGVVAGGFVIYFARHKIGIWHLKLSFEKEEAKLNYDISKLGTTKQ